jgi:hypothetical protein
MYFYVLQGIYWIILNSAISATSVSVQAHLQDSICGFFLKSFICKECTCKHSILLGALPYKLLYL